MVSCKNLQCLLACFLISHSTAAPSLSLLGKKKASSPLLIKKFSSKTPLLLNVNAKSSTLPKLPKLPKPPPFLKPLLKKRSIFPLIKPVIVPALLPKVPTFLPAMLPPSLIFPLIHPPPIVLPGLLPLNPVPLITPPPFQPFLFPHAKLANNNLKKTLDSKLKPKPKSKKIPIKFRGEKDFLTKLKQLRLRNMLPGEEYLRFRDIMPKLDKILF